MTTDPAWARQPPRVIVLATDLSSRCDRAMDRALQLARLWRARLIVATVVEPRPEGAAAAESPEWREGVPEASAAIRIQREFGDLLQHAELRVLTGQPAAAIDGLAREVGGELIVTGVARDEAVGRFLLGSTVDWLARRTPIPLLVVKRRALPYEEILIATDFSDLSQNALTAADRFFPAAPLTVLHGWEIPLGTMLGQARLRKQWRAYEQKACEDFLDRSTLSWQARARVKILVEHGRPEWVVHGYMSKRDVGLVVVASHGQSAWPDQRLGGTARRILETAPGDVLIIRGSGRAASRML